MAKYSFELKKEIVDAYFAGEDGYPCLANKYGIPQAAMVHRWGDVYNTCGDKGLLRSGKNITKSKGRKKPLDIYKTKMQSAESTLVNTSAEHVKQLEKELLKLKIENTYSMPITPLF